MIFAYLFLLFLVNAAPMENMPSSSSGQPASASSPDQPPPYSGHALDTFSNPDQCEIAFEAWKDMGGNPNSFPNPPEQCCGKFGIKCDYDGNIVELNWSYRGLNETLSDKLGKLHHLHWL